MMWPKWHTYTHRMKIMVQSAFIKCIYGLISGKLFHRCVCVMCIYWSENFAHFFICLKKSLLIYCTNIFFVVVHYPKISLLLFTCPILLPFTKKKKKMRRKNERKGVYCLQDYCLLDLCVFLKGSLKTTVLKLTSDNPNDCFGSDTVTVRRLKKVFFCHASCRTIFMVKW